MTIDKLTFSTLKACLRTLDYEQYQGYGIHKEEHWRGGMIVCISRDKDFFFIIVKGFYHVLRFNDCSIVNDALVINTAGERFMLNG